jgi:hypothetical protein
MNNIFNRRDSVCTKMLNSKSFRCSVLMAPQAQVQAVSDLLIRSGFAAEEKPLGPRRIVALCLLLATRRVAAQGRLR